MKKTLLFGMFLCGAAASFAQKNAPVYTEHIDSIISTGEADIVKKNYEYNKDGSCTMTQMCYDLITRRLVAKQITGGIKTIRHRGHPVLGTPQVKRY